MDYRALAVLIGMVGFAVLAAPAQDNYEIQVYSSEMDPPGTTTLEMHSNFTAQGRSSVRDGVVPTNHALHETLEVAHGFSDWFDTGIYLFTTIEPDAGWHFVGSHIHPRVTVPESWHWPLGWCKSADAVQAGGTLQFNELKSSYRKTPGRLLSAAQKEWWSESPTVYYLGAPPAGLSHAQFVCLNHQGRFPICELFLSKNGRAELTFACLPLYPAVRRFDVNAIARVDRDVLAQTGVESVIFMEGINDIGWPNLNFDFVCIDPKPDLSAAQIIAGYQQIIAKVHARGLKIFGGTITPFNGAFFGWTPELEEKREAINSFIRTSGAFDGVIDFASVVADSNDPTMLAPQFNSGDYVHPNDAGYEAMANAIDLFLFLPRR